MYQAGTTGFSLRPAQDADDRDGADREEYSEHAVSCEFGEAYQPSAVDSDCNAGSLTPSPANASLNACRDLGANEAVKENGSLDTRCPKRTSRLNVPIDEVLRSKGCQEVDSQAGAKTSLQGRKPVPRLVYASVGS